MVTGNDTDPTYVRRLLTSVGYVLLQCLWKLAHVTHPQHTLFMEYCLCRCGKQVKEAAGKVGTELGFGMFLRVNGAAILARGANMIPMDELEGRFDAEAHR